MRRASAASAGLASISQSTTTVVSAPSTISPAAAPTASAFASARRRTYATGSSSASGVSSTGTARTTNAMPAWRRISARRGDCEASTSIVLYDAIPGGRCRMGRMKNLARKLMVEPGRKVKLAKFDPGGTYGVDKQFAAGRLDKNHQRLSALQYMLYAEGRRSLLVVLQGIDAAGKDGTILHVMSGLNPQGVDVTSFKVPEGAEKRHDYLWRVHAAVPERGKIGIFNRSHYEDVLVVRVHDLVPKPVWSKRFDQINDFERMLTDNGVTIVKFLLYIGKDEQAKRFRERIDDKSKSWKFSSADLQERKYWDQYIEAYEDVLRKCGTDCAPWYLIPSNNKWFRNFAVSQILCEALEGMDLKFPKQAADLSGVKFE